MSKSTNDASGGAPSIADESAKIDQRRRATLRKLGRFAAVTAPVVTLLLSARAKPAFAVVS
jgi:hypothetical protein